MRFLGIDYGSKRIGLALSDEGGVMAFPDKIIANNMETLEHIQKLIVERGVEMIVIGESHDYSGEDNSIMVRARAFGEALTQMVGLPVLWHTEVLTTAHARRGGEKVSRPVARLRKAPVRTTVDASAAAIMLQSFLDLYGKESQR